MVRLLFFSRGIGLSAAGDEIPIASGGGLNGRIGRTGVGVMTIQTQSEGGRDGDNYTVLRGRRDILRNSDMGAIFLSRQSAGASTDRNQVAGADFNFRFVRALSINGFLAKSMTPGVGGGETAGKASVVWNDNRFHAQYSLLSVGDHFRDDLGFIKRTGVRKHFVDFGVRKRPSALRRIGIRELHPHTRWNIYTDQSNATVPRHNHLRFGALLETGRYVDGAGNARRRRRAGTGAGGHGGPDGAADGRRDTREPDGSSIRCSKEPLQPNRHCGLLPGDCCGRAGHRSVCRRLGPGLCGPGPKLLPRRQGVVASYVAGRQRCVHQLEECLDG